MGASHHPTFASVLYTQQLSQCLVPDVTEGGKDAAYAWAKGEPGGIIYWEELLL